MAKIVRLFFFSGGHNYYHGFERDRLVDDDTASRFPSWYSILKEQAGVGDDEEVNRRLEIVLSRRKVDRVWNELTEILQGCDRDAQSRVKSAWAQYVLERARDELVISSAGDIPGGELLDDPSTAVNLQTFRIPQNMSEK